MLNLKKVFSTCRDKFRSINGALVGRLLDEGMSQERTMLAQAETKSKTSFGNRTGRQDKSNGLADCQAEEGAISCTERDIISQEPITPNQREHREVTCGARLQEQEG
jgi:hypothetical protein